MLNKWMYYVKMVFILVQVQFNFADCCAFCYDLAPSGSYNPLPPAVALRKL